MNFANPLALWALPAAAVPLAIHLLSRRAARRLPFSDLTLLAAVEARSRPRTILRERALLAARTLLILALVLAAAGPVARGAAAGTGGEGVDLVLLLDASYSTRARDAGRSRFDMAREAGRRLLRRLAPGDRAAAGVFDERLQAPLVWQDAAAAARTLDAAVPGYRGTDAAAALTAARDLLSRSPRGRKRAVVVLGDGAAHMLPGPAPAPADGTTVLGLRFPAAPNSWIAGVRGIESADAREPRLEVRLAGTNARPAVDLWVGERRAGSGVATVPTGGEGRALIALPPAADPRAPSWAGRAATVRDALPEDDEAYFSLRGRAAPRVLVLHSDPSFDRAGRAGWYLRQLFGAGDRSLAGREADFLSVARWAEADLSRYGAVILPDAASLPSGLSGALERFVASGGGAWVIPGARATPESLAALSAWLPARFGAWETPSAGGLRVAAPSPETAGWEDFDLARVSFGRRFRLEAGPQSRQRLVDGGGAPLLIDGPVGRGRAVVWASPLDADWTNLGLKPVFVPWAALCLAATSPSAPSDEARSVRVGEPLVRAWRSDEPAPASVVVRGPDGRKTTLAVAGRRATLPSAETPGLYEFSAPGTAPATFAVNLDRSRGESDLSAANRPPWTETSPDALDDAFAFSVFGRDRRGWCLAAAALALLLEALLSLPSRALAFAAALLLLNGASAPRAAAQQGDRFVWTQLQLGPDWDPYPDAPARAVAWLAEITSARVAPDRRVIALSDPALFSSPFVYLAGREAPPPPSDADLRRLRQFLAGGGFLWIEDSTGGPPGSFDRWVRALLPQLLPEAPLRPLPPDHVLGRTFFLLRGPAGRVRVQGSLEGATWAGRVAVLYTRDDVLGAWARDGLGRPLKACVPGGEPQRVLAERQTLNVLMYSMTGSYKSDAVHQTAILDKLRGALP